MSSAPTDTLPRIRHALLGESWLPGIVRPNLSWTHSRTLLLRLDKPARGLYEIEAVKNNWAARELVHQINSFLYERLALSRDKKGLMRLVIRCQEVQQRADGFKDPAVMEFLTLPEPPRPVSTGLLDQVPIATRKPSYKRCNHYVNSFDRIVERLGVFVES